MVLSKALLVQAYKDGAGNQDEGGERSACMHARMMHAYAHCVSL